MLSYARAKTVFATSKITPFDPTGPTVQQAFVGTSNDDDFEGTSVADTFDLTQGGDDTVDAKAGADLFTLGGEFTEDDRLDGGADFDTLRLSGDYSGGVAFGANTLVNIENVVLEAGNGAGGSFTLALHENTVAANSSIQFAIENSAGDTALIVDGSANTEGTLVLIARGAAGDTLVGGGGNDVLAPGAAGDFLETIDGGAGINRVSFGGSGVAVNVSLAAQGAPQEAAPDWMVDMSNIQDISGTPFADLLTGNGADNWIVGNGGNDAMEGGNGDDFIQINNFGTMTAVAVDGGGGEDTLDFALSFSGGIKFSLAKQGDPQDTGQGFTVDAIRFENVVGSQTQGDKLKGDDGANKLYGSGGGDKLKGGDGDDEVYGDLEYGPTFGPGNSRTGFGTSTRTGADTLQGGKGNDLLEGGNADDKLIGGADVDTLNGGTGIDTFVFKKATDSGVGNGNRDTLDFNQADTDIVDLHKIDADTTGGGNQDFSLGGGAFTETAGELIQFTQSGKTIIAGDTDGDGEADFEIRLTTNVTLVAGDFDF
jgi:Ca2+-binding RTX toxin-like protein